MPRYKLTIAYDGTNYCGWQAQANGPSIQQALQKALSTFFKRESFSLTGSGRTDSGVHALSQVAHFDEEGFEKKRFLYAMRALLPADIHIVDVEEVASNFHARYSAKGKIYRYCIGLKEDPFFRRYQWKVHFSLSEELLTKGAQKLIGEHDFKGFSNANETGIAAYDSIRTLHRLEIKRENEKLFLEFEADGFLRQMVRNMVGTLVDIARDRLPLSCIDDAFETKSRSYAGQTAPAKGLFLVKVIY